MKKHILHKSCAVLSAACLCASLFSPLTAFAAENAYIEDGELSDVQVEAPAKDDVLPDANQYRYQKNELSAFCHFGPNTFNEIEWGENYGSRAPSEIFRLTNDFDEDTYVKALKDAGFTKLIVTAKHHDGFCIWNSAYTDYDAAAAGYKNGEGDVLAELSAACTKYGLEMGLYLSPWDIHDDSYGYKDANGNSLVGSNGQPLNGRTWEEVYELDAKDYNEYYNNQLQEILGNDKYGSNGHFSEVWMDGAKGSGSGYQEYDFSLWFDTIQNNEGKSAGYDADCMLFGAESYTGVRWIGNENGYAYKNTWSKSRTNRENNTIDSNSSGGYTRGWEDGNQWTVPEADARITSGWFWGNNKKTPKTLQDLGNMYFGSVGNNAVFLLNIPPNNQGTIDQAILDRVAEFGAAIDETFDQNLAVSAGASSVRGLSREYSPAHLLDGKDDTVWAPEDGENSATVLVNLGGTKTLDVVSIEEAIQYGQRINSWKVEAHTGADTWKTLDEGETIGAKKLVRTGALRADQIRITVSVPEGKVPVLSQVGVFKAAEGFEKTGLAPTGMDVTDINDSGFSFTGTWNSESGDQFINGTNKYANPGAEATLSFHGTRGWLIGTIDPNHGTADIYVDDQFVETINMSGSSRKLGQRLFDTGDLVDGDHTIRVVCKTKATGLEAAYSINNGGKGMVGIESGSYTMKEDQEMEVRLVRLGAADSSLSVTVSPNPGSAIQDDFDTELISHVTFGPGEKEKTALVRTRRNTNTTGDRQFSIELSSDDEAAILGWHDRAVITIQDADAMTAEKLLELVSEAKAMDSNVAAGDWTALNEAIKEAETKAAQGASAAQLQEAYDALQAVMNSFQARGQFSSEDPFVFPTMSDPQTTLEAEYSILHDVALASDGQWDLRVSEADWASGGKFVNCLNQQDTITIPYYAKQSGTYKVTVYYRSGDPKNNLVWNEPEGKIASGSVVAGAGDSAKATHSVDFTVQVTEPGAGEWIFTGPEDKSPQIDRFEISAQDLDAASYNITLNAGEGGTITGPETAFEGDSPVYAITPDDGYAVVDVKVNGQSLGAVTSATIENITADTVIEATFTFMNWTASNPFQFPKISGTLEAEEMELHNTGTNEDWPMQISTGSWCQNGKFLNAMNTNDTAVLYYSAPATGTYNVTLYFRSGDSANGFTWAEKDGKIASGSVQAGADDSARNTHTAAMTWTVLEPGPGELTLTAFAKNAPQMDRFELVKAVSTESLSNVIAQAEALLAGGTYTEDSAAALREAIASARELLADASATQAQIDAAADAVRAAMDALEEVLPPVVDKTALNELIDQAAGLDLDLYKDGAAKDAFMTALENAQTVSANESASEEDVNAAITALTSAMEGLERKEEPAEVDVQILEIVLAAAEALDLEKYTPVGQSEFMDALQGAVVMLTNPTSQDAVDQAARNLNMALMNLRLKADESLIASLKDFVRSVSLMNLEHYSQPVRLMAKAQIHKVQAALDAHEAGTAVLSMEEAKGLQEENIRVLKALQPGAEVPAEPSVKPEETKPEEAKPDTSKSAAEKSETSEKAEKPEKETKPYASSVKPAGSVKTAAGGTGLWLVSAIAALGAIAAGRKNRR